MMAKNFLTKELSIKKIRKRERWGWISLLSWRDVDHRKIKKGWGWVQRLNPFQGLIHFEKVISIHLTIPKETFPGGKTRVRKKEKGRVVCILGIKEIIKASSELFVQWNHVKVLIIPFILPLTSSFRFSAFPTLGKPWILAFDYRILYYINCIEIDLSLPSCLILPLDPYRRFSSFPKGSRVDVNSRKDRIHIV